MLTIGSRIRLERLRKGVSQAELARNTGIAQANISKIESGKQDILVSTLLQICAALGIRPATVFETKPRHRQKLTRSRFEKIIAAVIDNGLRIQRRDRMLVRLLRDTMIVGGSRRISKKATILSWANLRERLSDEEIEAFSECIQRSADLKDLKRSHKHATRGR